MKLSDKKQSELYAAISEPIMRVRVWNHTGYRMSGAVDSELFDLEAAIWKRIKTVLKLESQP